VSARSRPRAAAYPRSTYRPRRYSFWLRALAGFVAGEAVYFGAHAYLGLSTDAAMVNAFVAGAAAFLLFPKRRVRVDSPISQPIAMQPPPPSLPAATAQRGSDLHAASVPMREPAFATSASSAASRASGGASAKAERTPAWPRPGSGDDFSGMLAEAQIHALELRLMVRTQAAERVRSEVEAVCDACDRLVARLAAAGSPRLLYASRLQSTLATTREVVTSYLDMEADKLTVEKERREKVQTAVEKDFLPTISQALRDFGLRLDEPAVLDLESMVRATTTRLKTEGL
jgi:hypothetical protein